MSISSLSGTGPLYTQTRLVQKFGSGAQGGSDAAAASPTTEPPTKIAGFTTVTIPGLEAVTTDRLDELSAANVWYQMEDLTSDAGSYGRKETLESAVKIVSASGDQSTASLGQYKESVEATLKQKGWWDDASGAPRMPRSEINKPYTDPVTGTQTKRNIPQSWIGWDTRRLVRDGTTYQEPAQGQAQAAWLAEKQRLSSGMENDAVVRAQDKWLAQYSAQQPEIVGAGDVQTLVNNGGIAVAARVFDIQMKRGDYANVSFSGSWGDRKTNSVEEYGQWLQDAAAAATS